MDEGEQCPWCKQDIGIWPVVKAAWPTLIKCPTCGSKITYDIPLWRTLGTIILPFSLLIFCLSAGPIYLVYKKFTPKSLLLAAVIFCVLWLIFEYANAVFWRNHKKLKILYKKSQG